MMNSLHFLGLAKKAGCLEIGEEPCVAAVRSGKARVLLTAADAAENSRRRAAVLAGDTVPHILLPFHKHELGAEVGRGTPGILAITDVGMAAGFAAKLSAEFPGQFTDAADTLSQKNAKARQRQSEAKAHLRNVKTGKRRMKK